MQVIRTPPPPPPPPPFHPPVSDHRPRIVRAPGGGVLHRVERRRCCLPRVKAVLARQWGVLLRGVGHQLPRHGVGRAMSLAALVQPRQQGAQVFTGGEVHNGRGGRLWWSWSVTWFIPIPERTGDSGVAPLRPKADSGGNRRAWSARSCIRFAIGLWTWRASFPARSRYPAPTATRSAERSNRWVAPTPHPAPAFGDGRAQVAVAVDAGGLHPDPAAGLPDQPKPLMPPVSVSRCCFSC